MIDIALTVPTDQEMAAFDAAAKKRQFTAMQQALRSTSMYPALTVLLFRLTPETLALAYRDVTEVDDILTDDLASAIFAALGVVVGVDQAVAMLDLVGVPTP